MLSSKASQLVGVDVEWGCILSTDRTRGRERSTQETAHHIGVEFDTGPLDHELAGFFV